MLIPMEQPRPQPLSFRSPKQGHPGTSQSLLHHTRAQLAGRKAEEAGDGPACACNPLPVSWGKLPGSGLRSTAAFHVPRYPALQQGQRLERTGGALARASLPHCHPSKPCQAPTDVAR